MKKLLFATIILISTACSSASTPAIGDIQTAIAKTQVNQVIETPSIQTLEPKIMATNTPRPTNTTIPTETITPVFVLDLSKVIAKNYVISQESGGVIIEVGRIIIAEKNAIKKDFSEISLFDDKPIVIELVFRIVNNTNKTVTVTADQAKIAINGEQIELWPYVLAGAHFGDLIGGEILPGVTAIGGGWVGVKRTDFEDINKIIIQIGSPYDEDFNELGPKYNFDIDIINWVYEDLPEEFK